MDTTKSKPYVQRKLHMLQQALSLVRDAIPQYVRHIVVMVPATVQRVETIRELRRPEAEVQQEINGSKSLLLEIIRRAAYDWVLYRSSRRMLNKRLAEESFIWLFKEVPGHPNWDERTRNKKHLTSFVAICEALDLDPDTMRAHIRRLTAKNVMNVGRPAEYRRTDRYAEETLNELPVSLKDSVPVDFDPFEDQHM